MLKIRTFKPSQLPLRDRDFAFLSVFFSLSLSLSASPFLLEGDLRLFLSLGERTFPLRSRLLSRERERRPGELRRVSRRRDGERLLSRRSRERALASLPPLPYPPLPRSPLRLLSGDRRPALGGVRRLADLDRLLLRSSSRRFRDGDLLRDLLFFFALLDEDDEEDEDDGFRFAKVVVGAAAPGVFDQPDVGATATAGGGNPNWAWSRIMASAALAVIGAASPGGPGGEGPGGPGGGG